MSQLGASLDSSPSQVACAPAVHSVDEFVFTVPDLDAARQFYTAFGLEVRGEGTALALYTAHHPHRWGRIFRGPTKRLLWLTLGIHATDEVRFAEKLKHLNIDTIAPPAGARSEGIWIKGPDDLPIQLKSAPKSSPSIKSLRVFPPEVSERGRSPCRRMVAPVRPNHLSHILLFSDDVDTARHFYTAVLGLKLSDHSGAGIAFLHSPHGSDHHLIAFAKGHGYGLHHTSWDVSSLDDVALGSEQMARAGFAQGWGIGRHVLGSNYFRYVRDPWGSYAEYSFDIDFIPAGFEWPSGDYLPEDALYVWGPEVPQDFIVNYETC